MMRYGWVVCTMAVLLSCASESEFGNVPRLASALDDSSLTDDSNPTDDSGPISELYTVSVTLVADNPAGFFPQYSDRVLVAEPVVPRVSRQASARLLVQGIDTIVIGQSCADLYQRYPQLISCELSETVAPEYQEPVATATTDSEGFATFTLGQGAHRISLQSWPTLEDTACRWGGSALLADQQSSIEISLMVFCE